MARENEIRVKRPPVSQHQEIKNIAAKLGITQGELIKRHLTDITSRYGPEYRNFKREDRR